MVSRRLLVMSLCMLAAGTAHAGGKVPVGLGMYGDGRAVDTIPASGGIVRWREYGSVLTPETRDWIAFAVATVDVETTRFRLIYGDPDPGQVVIYLSAKSDALSPGCTDTEPGGCTYGSTQCLESTVESTYRLCTQYRVSLYMANIEWGASQKGIPLSDFLPHIVRHEVGHALGLSHATGGVMAGGTEFTACHLALWSLYAFDPNFTGWTSVPAPQECN